MGLGHSIVSELNFDSLKMSHSTPRTLVQPAGGGDALWYVVYRFIMAFYIIGSLLAGALYSREENTERLIVMHLPVWGYFAALIQSVLLAICALHNYYSAYKRMAEAAPKQKEKKRRSSIKSKHLRARVKFTVTVTKMPKIYMVIWIAHYIMLYISLITFIMFKTELFRGRIPQVIPSATAQRRSPSQIMLHIVFLPYCILDFFVCGIPIRLLHFYVVTIFVNVYQMLLLVLTIVFSKMYENFRPLYDAVDIQASRMPVCSLYFIGFGWITPIAGHICYWYLYLIKVYIGELYFRATHVVTKPYQHVQEVASGPEEKEVEGAPEWTPGAIRSTKIMPISEQEESEMNNSLTKDSPSHNSIALVDTK